ncbi:MAG: DUF799 family lipoprotein [Thermodesulfobacteriota bacterium]|nr:DUF799 family lipoprotein [Thermodesulfobacteriota bacterium]
MKAYPLKTARNLYLSTITRPLAEMGYYVFPVAVIDVLIKENGVPSPEDMAEVPLSKIQEVINPDAVLYMTVVEWGTKYRVIDSVTIVHVKGSLIDTNTGIVLWEGEHTVTESSSSGQNSIIGMLVAALVNQIVTSFSDPSRDVARATNAQLFLNQHNGLLLGPRHSQFEMDQRDHRALQNQTISESSRP